MQLPFFHFDLAINVQMMPDSWVIKLSVEACQLLATSYSYDELILAPRTQKGTIRSNKSHPNHPITKWANHSLGNWLHAVDFAIMSIEEYKYRFETDRDPFHINFINWCKNNVPNLPDLGFTDPYKPIGYEHLGICESYQEYFNDKKQHIAVWRKRGIPSWFRKK